MKIYSLSLLTVILFLISCAGVPESSDETPGWIDLPVTDTETHRGFRGAGNADSLSAAESMAIEDLKLEILRAMSLEESDALTAMLDKLEAMIRNPETAGVDGVELIHSEGWKNPDGSISYAVEISWENEAFNKQRAYIAGLSELSSTGFQNLEYRARAAEDDGNAYEAALIWAAAAGIAQRNGNNSGYRNALIEVEKVLVVLSFQLDSIPNQSYVGIRPEAPVLFSVSAGGKPVSNAEFLISYPKNARDGSPSIAQARIVSDDEGVVRFLPPEIPYAGIQIVSIALSADPFLEYLEESGDAPSGRLIQSLEKARGQAEYEALSRIRTIAMGILILETDIAGNALKTTDAARGLFDDLNADGFNIDIMDLNPSQMLSRTDQALLRDLKADLRFTDVYQRVIHGTVALENFEQNGDSYTVRVSGTLAMSDINRQVTLYKSEITKTSQASDSQQAISSAFRQLGRSFAGELIEQAP